MTKDLQKITEKHMDIVNAMIVSVLPATAAIAVLYMFNAAKLDQLFGGLPPRTISTAVYTVSAYAAFMLVRMLFEIEAFLKSTERSLVLESARLYPVIGNPFFESSNTSRVSSIFNAAGPVISIAWIGFPVLLGTEIFFAITIAPGREGSPVLFASYIIGQALCIVTVVLLCVAWFKLDTLISAVATSQIIANQKTRSLVVTFFIIWVPCAIWLFWRFGIGFFGSLWWLVWEAREAI